MKIIVKAWVILVFTFSIASNAFSVELSDRYDPSHFKSRTTVIDPDQSAYDVPFGAKESEVIQQVGLPNGVIRVNRGRKILLYGKSHAFIFRKGLFRELRVSRHLIDWKLSEQMESHPFFDNEKWTINPGITGNMSYEEVMQSLGRASGPGDHRFAFDTDNATVKLTFSSMRMAGDTSPKYSLMGFHIVHYGN